MIKNIAFDCGGVLIFGNHFIKHFIQTTNLTISEEKFWNFLSKMEAGFATISELDPTLEDLWKRNLEQIGQYNDELIKFTQEIKNRIGVGILSNVDKDLANTKTNLNIYDKFETVILSCNVKSVKPDAKIYLEYANAVNLDPSEILFIDDKKKYVDAAIDYGFNAFQFVDNADAIAKIKRLI